MSPALGRAGRFSMTPPMQAVYRAIAAGCGGDFRLRDVCRITGRRRADLYKIMTALAERGWVTKIGTAYRLTQPVMMFRACAERDAA